METKTFGQTLNEARRARELTLREFCRLAGEDPANYSRIERGLSKAPVDSTIERYANVLHIEGEELKHLKQLALASRRELPKDIPENVLAAHLPIMLCTIDGSIPTSEQAKNALNFIKDALEK